jgi:hypothetical protein
MSSRRGTVLALVVAAVVVASCADDGPAGGAAPSRSTAASPPAATSPVTTRPASSAPATTAAPRPDEATDPRPPLPNGDGENEAFSGVGRLDGLGSSCTAFLLAVGEPSGPAYALTNGHCVGLFDNTSVVRDAPAEGASVRFRLFADRPDDEAVVPVETVLYGTMRGTDVAVLQLAATRSDVIGLASYALARPPSAGDEIRVVGVPVVGVPADEQVLRGDTCTAGEDARLVEFEWLWDAPIGGDCAGILGGNSGSPVFAADDPTRVVAVVNTTTIGAATGVTCYLGQPCELAADGATMRTDRTYAMPVADWEDCFSPAWDPTAAGCPVEPAPTTVDAPSRAVQPGATWAAPIGGGVGGPYQAKTGPAGATDCRRSDGYVPAGPTFDAALPATEDVYVLCAASLDGRGAPDAAQAGAAVMVVDATPPDTAIGLSRIATADGLRVEPIFAPPELMSFETKVGPAGEVDCAAAEGYAIYRRIPIAVPGAALPATLCVVGEDEAGNKGAPQSFELTAVGTS